MELFRSNENIEIVIERYKKMVFGIAFSYTKNRNDADDVFQEVFLTYYRKNVAFNDEEHRKAWLIRVTINCSKRVISSVWKKVVPFEETADSDFQFEIEEQNVIFNALSELPHKYRIVLYLFYFEEMSIIEISKSLKIKEGTVKVQLNRGRNLAREKLKGEYFNE